MIPEIHTSIHDPFERNIDLDKITKHIKGYKSFGQWNNGICYVGWNMLNNNQIVYTLSKYNLYFPPKVEGEEFIPIKWVGDPPTNSFCQLI